MAVACQSGTEHFCLLLLFFQIPLTAMRSAVMCGRSKELVSTCAFACLTVAEWARLHRSQAAGLAPAAHDKACCAGLELLAGILSTAKPGSTGK